MKRRLLNLLTLLSLVVSAPFPSGCGTPSPNPAHPPGEEPPTTYTITHYQRTLTLTRERPRDTKLGVTLVRVEPDGTAVIDVASTGERLAAAPGRPFLGKRGGRYHVRTFGESGLELEDSNPKAQSAVLVSRWAGSESHHGKAPAQPPDGPDDKAATVKPQ